MAVIMPEEKKFDRDPAEGQFPSGTYYCKLDAIREVGPSPKFPDSGPRLVFDFVVADGPHAGKRTAQFCGKKLWSNPKLNKERPFSSSPGSSGALTRWAGSTPTSI
jgi:hypothetical protein